MPAAWLAALKLNAVGGWLWTTSTPTPLANKRQYSKRLSVPTCELLDENLPFSCLLRGCKAYELALDPRPNQDTARTSSGYAVQSSTPGLR